MLTQGGERVLEELQSHSEMTGMKGLAEGYVWLPQIEKGKIHFI